MSPSLSDLRFSFDMLSVGSDAWMVSDRGYRALMQLVAFSAAGLVWTYSPPGDGSIPDEDDRLARICRLSPAVWRRVRPELEPFFTIKNGRWLLNREWIAVDDRPVRFAIPLSVQKQVLTRQGKVCTYCSDTKGPFHFDHILPVSKGGSNDASNLTLACMPCNTSKGGKTLVEWMASRRPSSMDQF